MENFKAFFLADEMFKKLIKAHVTIHKDGMGHIVAKGFRDKKPYWVVTFYGDFNGSEAERLLSQAEFLMREFKL